MSLPPFGFTLYCPTGEYRPEHGLVLNIRVPPDFFRVAGQPSDREVLLGLTLGGSQHVPGPQGGIHVPLLVPELDFSTLFAPTPVQGSRMHAAGRACILIL